MKKVSTILFACVITLIFINTAFAGRGDRFKAGTTKFIKSPLQMTKIIKEEYEVAKFKPFGIVGGSFKGLFYFGKDLGRALWEMLTFNTEFIE